MHRVEEEERMLALVWLSVFEGDGNGGRRWPNDSLLRHCAERIAARLTETDVLAHLGGADFAVLVNSSRASLATPCDLLATCSTPSAGRFSAARRRSRRASRWASRCTRTTVTSRVACCKPRARPPSARRTALPERRSLLAFSSAKLNGEAAPSRADPQPASRTRSRTTSSSFTTSRYCTCPATRSPPSRR